MGFGGIEKGSLHPHRPGSETLVRFAVRLSCLLACVVLILFAGVLLLTGFIGDTGEMDVIAAGIVVDERGLPVSGASATILPPSVVTTTNDAGFFRTHHIVSGGSFPTLVLEVKKPGFKTAIVNIGNGGQLETLKIKLEAERGHALLH